MALLALLACTVVAGYFLWLRDSSLVAVHRLTVTGAEGPQGQEIRAALADAAKNMTTLHVRQDELDRAVRRFPIVESVSADASFPNGLTIQVHELEPALTIAAGGRRTAVAADGTILRGIEAPSGLPRLTLPAAPAGERLQGDALAQALVLGATPGAIRPFVQKTSVVEGGVRVALRDAPEVRFGEATEVRLKWAAATRVLADKALGRAGYVDVSAPGRPAVGGIVQPVAASPAPPATPGP
jgi:cell division protein FtsQ